MSSEAELYYEAYETPDGWWMWKVYHYDNTGNREVIIRQSVTSRPTKEEAEDACSEFMDEEGIDARLA